MKGTLIGIAVTLLSASSWAVDLNAIYNNLDITSFNSSLRAMQINQEDTFSDFKELSQPIISGKEIIIEDDFWLLSLEVVKEDGNDIIPASKTERKEEAITYSSL